MQNSLRVTSISILEKVQILYQNKVIDYEQKNHISKLLKNALLDNNSLELKRYLENIRRNIDVNFKDIVSDMIISLN